MQMIDMRTMEALDILKVARARVATPEMWGKGRRNKDRPMDTCCLAEAFDTSPTGPEYRRAIRAMHHAIGVDDLWGELIAWNDAPERTHDEILAAFNLAIATLRLR
jgi:hypothetical protein